MAQIFFHSPNNAIIGLEYTLNGVKKTWSINKGEWITESIDKKFLNFNKNFGDIGIDGNKRYTCEYTVPDEYKTAFVNGLKYFGSVSILDEAGVEQSLAPRTSRKTVFMIDLDSKKTRDILWNKKVTSARLKVSNLYDEAESVQEMRDLAVHLGITVTNRSLDDLFLDLTERAGISPDDITKFHVDARTAITIALEKGKNYERQGSPMVYTDPHTNRVHFYDSFEKPFGSMDILVQTLLEDKERAEFFLKAIAVEDAKSNDKLTKTASVKYDKPVAKKEAAVKPEKITPNDVYNKFIDILNMVKIGDLKEELAIDDLNKVCGLYLETNAGTGNINKVSEYLDNAAMETFKGTSTDPMKFMSDTVFKEKISKSVKKNK